MADHTPGQVITPNGGNSDGADGAAGVQNTDTTASAPPPTQPAPPVPEVQVPLGPREAAAQPAPASPSPAADNQPAALPPQPANPEPLPQTPLQPPVAPATDALQDTPPQQFAGAVEPAPFVPAPNLADSPMGDVAYDAPGAISWTASEYIAHQKSTAWYVVLGLAAIAAAAAVYFITDGDIISTVVIVLVAIVFGIYAGRKPNVQQYRIGPEGITIGPKLYGFDHLKSFAVIDEGAFSSIMFMPLKRFMPTLTIYYDPKDEGQIVDLLAGYLPMEQRGHDAIDRLMKKIRF